MSNFVQVKLYLSTEKEEEKGTVTGSMASGEVLRCS